MPPYYTQAKNDFYNFIRPPMAPDFYSTNAFGGKVYIPGLGKNKSYRSQGRYMMKGCRKTKAYKASVAKQKTITAPMSRVVDCKHVDQLTSIAGLKSTVPTGGIVGEIAGGSTEGQRVGNDIRIIRYLITLEIKHGSEANDQTFRLLLVRAKTANSNSLTALDSLLNVDALGNKTPMSLRNVGSLEDFEVLMDKMLVLKNNTGSTNHALQVQNYIINTCFPQRFSGTGSTTIIRNPVFWYMVTNSANVTTAATGYLSFRIQYSDVS